jgi:hypothetical protein
MVRLLGRALTVHGRNPSMVLIRGPRSFTDIPTFRQARSRTSALIDTEGSGELDEGVENLEGSLKGRAEGSPIGAQGDEQLDKGLPEVIQCVGLGLAIAKNIGLGMMYRHPFWLPVELNVEGRRKLKAWIVEALDNKVCGIHDQMGGASHE